VETSLRQITDRVTRSGYRRPVDEDVVDVLLACTGRLRRPIRLLRNATGGGDQPQAAER